MLTGSSHITEESRKYVTKTIVGSALVTVVTVPVLDFRCQCLQQQENQHWHWPGTSRELVTWLRHLNKGFLCHFYHSQSAWEKSKKQTKFILFW